MCIHEDTCMQADTHPDIHIYMHTHPHEYILTCLHSYTPAYMTHIHMYMHVLKWNLELAIQEDYSDAISCPLASVSPPVGGLVFINH